MSGQTGGEREDKGFSDLAVLLVWTVADALGGAVTVNRGADVDAAMDDAAAQVDAILSGPAGEAWQR